MIPSAYAIPRRSPLTCPCCRRRRRNVAAGRPPLVASSLTARALAAGLWRLRQAERSSARRQDNLPRALLGGRKAKARSDFGVGRQQQSFCTRKHGHGNGILDKIEAEYGFGGLMEEKASKRWRVEAAVEMRKAAEEKAWWKSKARCAAMALREERQHRRQLEAANGRLLKKVERERKAREVMEAACEQLSKEVEEDQAEVEALRRECVAMREEMEEERRMLQMAEVWREERVQMKLSDARAVLEHKYAHLNSLHADMDSFLRRLNHNKHALLFRTRMADAATSLRAANHHFLSAPAPAAHDHNLLFDHFRRNTTHTNNTDASPSSSVASPATDLFLEKADADVDVDAAAAGGGWAWETPPPAAADRAASTSNSASNNNNNGGSGVTEEGGSGRSRRSGNFNTALIRRLWRSALSESRKKTAAASSSGRSRVVQSGCSPSYSDRNRDRDRDSARSSVIDPASQAAKEEEKKKKKKSLMEKLMEARMDDAEDRQKKPQAAA
ncbi:uncharacterized protein LOC102707228 [Oryza brachyantha]|uniref:uncharacterized protein LOC102707228 n=1 Tax=Oryza brachyantha TaxID=4533 RepID=UPI001ADA7CC1|nr:uncharacterized protein LOC102707228 [Oryza brachyantha]